MQSTLLLAGHEPLPGCQIPRNMGRQELPYIGSFGGMPKPVRPCGQLPKAGGLVPHSHESAVRRIRSCQYSFSCPVKCEDCHEPQRQRWCLQVPGGRGHGTGAKRRCLPVANRVTAARRLGRWRQFGSKNRGKAFGVSKPT